MPWCEECDHLVDEEELDEHGACPRCGTVLTAPAPRRVPWYFVVMILATVAYLIWRLVQGIEWLTHHL